MAALDKLATELICQILEYLEPPAIHSIALVSRRLAGIATEELRFCRKYRAISDQQPATVPSLLRDLQGNSRAARRVRSIEIYGTRLAWDHWNDANVYKLTFPEGHDAPPAADASMQGIGPGFFDETELERFYHLMVDDLSMAPDAAEKWRALIAEGNDAALKALLIALCPRLTAVRFVQSADLRDGRRADESPPETEQEDTRSLLASAIVSIFATAQKKWPPGLLSLEDVALGVKSKSTSESWDATVHSSAQIGTPVASRFFCLPNLKNIYIHGLTGVFGRDDYGVAQHPWGPAKWCSSVQNILLDDPNEPELEALQTMFRSSAPTLRSIIFHGGTFTESFHLGRFFRCTEYTCMMRSPETLLFCSTALQGYHSRMYDFERINVPVAVADAVDIWCDFDSLFDRTYRTEQEVWREDPLPHYCGVTVFNGTYEAADEPMIDQHLAAFIRRGAGGWDDDDEDEDDDDEDEDDDDEDEDDEDEDEDDTGEGEDEGEDEGDDEEDHGGEQGNNDNDNPPDIQEEDHGIRYLPDMALYLTSLDDYPAERTYRWWSKTIAAGKKCGIKVHTRTTKPPRGNDYGFHVQWPEGVSDNILETSPWHKHPSLPKVYFKPHVGFVEDCEHCGRCEECFKCYPPEVWAGIKKEEREESEEME